MMIGSITLPVGSIMYVLCGLSQVSIVEFAREVFPFNHCLDPGDDDRDL